MKKPAKLQRAGRGKMNVRKVKRAGIPANETLEEARARNEEKVRKLRDTAAKRETFWREPEQTNYEDVMKPGRMLPGSYGSTKR